jgi:branched-chain amino acid transport system permease protein
MVLLGGLQTLFGPVAGAALLTWLQDTLARHTEYWRAMLGAAILVLVLLFPQGIVGALARVARGLGQRGAGARAAATR